MFFLLDEDPTTCVEKLKEFIKTVLCGNFSVYEVSVILTSILILVKKSSTLENITGLEDYIHEIETVLETYNKKLEEEFN